MLRAARLSAALLFTLAASVTAASGSDAKSVSFNIFNRTDVCAWVTIYWSYHTQAGWHIAGEGHNRPRYVAPGTNWISNVNYSQGFFGPQIRYRAQMTYSAHCGGATVRDIQTDGHIAYPAKDLTLMLVDITGSKHNYSISSTTQNR